MHWENVNQDHLQHIQTTGKGREWQEGYMWGGEVRWWRMEDMWAWESEKVQSTKAWWHSTNRGGFSQLRLPVCTAGAMGDKHQKNRLQEHHKIREISNREKVLGWTGAGSRGSSSNKLNCSFRGKNHLPVKGERVNPFFAHFLADDAGIEILNMTLNAGVFNPFYWIYKRFKLKIVLANGEFPLFACWESPFCVLLHETVTKNLHESIQQFSDWDQSEDGEFLAIQIHLHIQDTRVVGIVNHQIIVPVLSRRKSQKCQ